MKVIRSGPLFIGDSIAAPVLRANLVSLSKRKPVGPAFFYDSFSASNSNRYWFSIYRLLETGKFNMEAFTIDYMRMSRIYSFLRSKKGLPYYENWYIPPKAFPRMTLLDY